MTNVGKTYSGKEVVQTYFSAPQTGIDKPYQELAGYAKTDDSGPGASQILTHHLRHHADGVVQHGHGRVRAWMPATT